MNIFVTGGAGFIGTHTCVELLKKNHKVLVFDNLITGSRTALDRIEEITNHNIDLTIGDIRDYEELVKVMNSFSPDIVIHFAGLKSVNESISDPLKYYDVNVKGALVLLEAMKNVNCKKIIFSSSATVYGEALYLPYDEHHPLSPTNPYGHTKLMIEQILKDWVKSDQDNSAVCLRYFNPIGAHKSGLIGEESTVFTTGLMPHIAKVAAGLTESLFIYGDNYPTRDGTGERDFVHILDLAECHVAVVDKISELDRFQALNVATGRGTTVRELVQTFEKVIGRQIKSVIMDRRSGDVAKCWADPSLSENLLGFKCERSILEMCQDAWRWQRKNPRGYYF